LVKTELQAMLEEQELADEDFKFVYYQRHVYGNTDSDGEEF
jgi:hypothetical protein